MLVKIRIVAAELPHSDRQVGRRMDKLTKLIVVSRSLTNATKTELDWGCRSFLFYNLLFQTSVASIKLYQFTLSMYAETHVGPLLKCVLNLTDLNALR
jgi:hypothetical protein